MVVQDMAARYGEPVVVLNLVKGAEKRPRESILQAELAAAIAYINKSAVRLPPRICSPPSTDWRLSLRIFVCQYGKLRCPNISDALQW